MSSEAFAEVRAISNGTPSTENFLELCEVLRQHNAQDDPVIIDYLMRNLSRWPQDMERRMSWAWFATGRGLPLFGKICNSADMSYGNMYSTDAFPRLYKALFSENAENIVHFKALQCTNEDVVTYTLENATWAKNLKSYSYNGGGSLLRHGAGFVGGFDLLSGSPLEKLHIERLQIGAPFEEMFFAAIAHHQKKVRDLKISNVAVLVPGTAQNELRWSTLADRWGIYMDFNRFSSLTALYVGENQAGLLEQLQCTEPTQTLREVTISCRMFSRGFGILGELRALEKLNILSMRSTSSTGALQKNVEELLRALPKIKELSVGPLHGLGRLAQGTSLDKLEKLHFRYRDHPESDIKDLVGRKELDDCLFLTPSGAKHTGPAFNMRDLRIQENKENPT